MDFGELESKKYGSFSVGRGGGRDVNGVVTRRVLEGGQVNLYDSANW